MNIYLEKDKALVQKAVEACTEYDLTTTDPILNGLQQAYQAGDSLLMVQQLWLLHRLGGNNENAEFIQCVANMLTSVVM